MGLHAGHGHGPGATAAPLAKQPERLRSIYAALAVALALFVAKLAVFLVTGLVVMLAEAMHSLTDALQTGFLLGAAKLSAKPPDEAHPFGHGRGENLAAIVVAILVVGFVVVELVRESLDALTTPRPPPTQPSLALVVLFGSALMMLWPLLLARRDMARHGGVVRAQAMESLNDLLGVLAAAIGIALVMSGFPLADPIAALVVAAIIVYNAVRLFLANMPFLVGGSPPHEFYERVERIATGMARVRGVHSMAAEYVGPTEVHLDMNLTVPAEMTIDEADELSQRVRDRLEQELDIAHVTIHFCCSEGERRRVGPDTEGRPPAASASAGP